MSAHDDIKKAKLGEMRVLSGQQFIFKRSQDAVVLAVTVDCLEEVDAVGVSVSIVAARKIAAELMNIADAIEVDAP